LTVGWPGSVADGRVWNNSILKKELETKYLANIPSIPVATRHPTSNEMQYEQIPPFILIDSAYPSTKHTVPTFKTTECRRNPLVKQLNRKLSSIRYCIEQAFGICKNRFRVFNRPLECAKDDVKQATKLITAIFTLHNFLLDEESDDDIEDEDLDCQDDERNEGERNEGEIDAADQDDQDFSTRDILLRHSRWLMDD